MTILKGPLKNTEGMRQLVDQITLMNKHEQASSKISASIFTDIKLENIVFSQSASSTTSEILVKIIDFGVASQPGEDRCRMITNPYWRSPESWAGIPWGPAADIWSFEAVIGSLLMEPGAKLFQPMGGLAGVPPEEQDRELLRSL
ncbi:hypothetical protein IFR05_013123 [Cadophora sp. M221]|nr:hypothetical protein IFR05_013123 [Cadophora sp. M221]